MFFRTTNNWLELTVRFIVTIHRIRSTKDAMSREILRGMEAIDVGIASATYDIVGFPKLRVEEIGHFGADAVC